jgi:hypothetical protein
MLSIIMGCPKSDDSPDSINPARTKNGRTEWKEVRRMVMNGERVVLLFAATSGKSDMAE